TPSMVTAPALSRVTDTRATVPDGGIVTVPASVTMFRACGVRLMMFMYDLLLSSWCRRSSPPALLVPAPRHVEAAASRGNRDRLPAGRNVSMCDAAPSSHRHPAMPT